MNSIDRFFCDLFQRLTDNIQELVGLDCFSLAQISSLYPLLENCRRKSSLGLIIVTGLYAVAIWVSSANSRRVLQANPGFLNSDLASARKWRFFYLGFQAFALIIFTFDQRQAPLVFICSAYTVTIYLMSCTPRPGSPSKLKKLVESIFPEPRATPLPQPN